MESYVVTKNGSLLFESVVVICVKHYTKKTIFFDIMGIKVAAMLVF